MTAGFHREHSNSSIRDEHAGTETRSFPYRYRVYGQAIASECSFPELETTLRQEGFADGATLEIVRHPIDETRGIEGVNGVVRAEPGEVLLHYDLAGAFLVQNGSRIVVSSEVDLAVQLARHFVLGVCSGIALHQRKHLTLHASGVALEGGVAAFIGWKRRGKSTTAAAVYASGGRLVTDDIVAIPPGEATVVSPGYARMRLDPEAVAATLGVSPEDLPRLHERSDKRIGDASHRFQQMPLPLRCIYALEWGDDFSIERLSQREAFVQLLQHSYAQRFLGRTAATPSYFERVKDVVKQVPVVVLQRPRSLEQIPRLVRFVRSHFQSL